MGVERPLLSTLIYSIIMDHGHHSNNSEMLLKDASTIPIGSPLLNNCTDKSLLSSDDFPANYSRDESFASFDEKNSLNTNSVPPLSSTETVPCPPTVSASHDDRIKTMDITMNTIASGSSVKSPTAGNHFISKPPIRKEEAGTSHVTLLSKKVEKFRKKNLKSLLPQIDDLPTAQLERLLARTNPDKLSANVRSYFHPSYKSLPGPSSRIEDDAGELTDVSDLDEPLESLGSARCKWADEKVQLGSADASIAELIENKTILLDTMLAKYNTMNSLQFETKSYDDSCARSRGLLHPGQKSPPIHLKNASFTSKNCYPSKGLQKFVNNKTIENAMEKYMYLLSHIPKVLVRTRIDQPVSKSSEIKEEHERNGYARLLAKKEKRERKGEQLGFEEVEISDEDQRRRLDFTTKRKRGRPPKDSNNISPREPAKVQRRHSVASGSRPFSGYDFEDLVPEMNVLHKPVEMEYKEIWVPNWSVVKRKSHHIPVPCSHCDLDIAAKIALDHHSQEYDEKRRFFAKLVKEKERVLPDLPRFDIDSINSPPIVCSSCPPYPRRKYQL